MKKILFFSICLLLIVCNISFSQTSVSGAGGGPTNITGSSTGSIKTSTNCDAATYHQLGILCQDIDDGKVYKWTGSATEELGSGSGSVATDSIFDASGDLVQGTGSNTAERLALGTEGKILRAGAAKAAWSTSTFADTYAKGTILYNASANTVAALAHPGAANYLLYTNAADTSAWLQSSANMISLLGSADYATARTNLGLAIGTNVQGYNANLAAIAGITTADKSIIQWTGSGTGSILTCNNANQLIGVNAANDALECKSTINIQMDDSAAQFKSATASKGTLKFLQTSIDNGILTTVTPVCTGNCTLTTESYGAGTYTLVDKTSAQTLTNKTLTAPYITAPEVLYASTWLVSEAAYTFSAAEVSRTIINTFGRGAACDPTLPTAAAGMTFIIVVGAQHASDMSILKGASDMYWETAGVPTLVAGFKENNQVVGSRASCATFKTGAAAWSWVCGAVSGTWSAIAL